MYLSVKECMYMPACMKMYALTYIDHHDHVCMYECVYMCISMFDVYVCIVCTSASMYAEN